MSEATQKREAQGRRQSPMSPRGHSRPMQPVLPAGSCPLRSESDLHPALPRNDAIVPFASFCSVEKQRAFSPPATMHRLANRGVIQF
jgi:hypothetical protein